MQSGHGTRRRTVLVAALGVAALVAAVPARLPRRDQAEDAVDAVDALQRALDAVPDGGEFVVHGSRSRSRPLQVDHPVTIRFAAGASLRMAADVTAIVITASDVEVIDPVVWGIGADSGGVAHAIAAAGRPGAPIHDVRIRGGRLRDVPHDGVHLEYCDRFEVSGIQINRAGYAGVLGIGVVDGTVSANRITDVRQPAGRVNSYGITLTRDATDTTTVTRRSARVRVTDNHVTDVPGWEGIDTHAGDGIEIRGNVVERCRVGIAAVPSKDPSDRSQTSVAPIGLVIADNTVTRNAGLAAGSGIVVSGAGTTVGSSRPRATGTVTGNVVSGGGGRPGEAGILLKLTAGLDVSDNRIERSSDGGLCLAHSNSAVTVRDNRIAGVDGAGVGIDVRAGANDGSITGNHFGVSAPPLRVAVRFGSADNRFLVTRNAWGTARVSIAVNGAEVRES